QAAAGEHQVDAVLLQADLLGGPVQHGGEQVAQDVLSDLLGRGLLAAHRREMAAAGRLERPPSLVDAGGTPPGTGKAGVGHGSNGSTKHRHRIWSEWGRWRMVWS